MRRAVVTSVLIVLAVVGVGTPASAATSPNRKWCRALVALATSETRTSSGPTRHELRTIRRQAIAVTHAPPRAVAGAARTLGTALADLVDHEIGHGKKVTTARRSAATTAQRRLLTFGAAHCRGMRAVIAAGAEVARARAAQSALRAGLTNAKGLYTDTDSYAGATVAALTEAEPALHFTDGPTDPADRTAVSVHIVGPTEIVMAAGTGTTCWFIRDSATGNGTEFAQAPGSACDAAASPATWSTSWR